MKCQEITLEGIRNLFGTNQQGKLYCKVCCKVIKQEESDNVSILAHHATAEHLVFMVNFTIENFQKIGNQRNGGDQARQIILFDLQKAQEYSMSSSDKLKNYFIECIEEQEGLLENCKPSTKMNYIIVIRRFYKFLLSNGINHLDIFWMKKYLEDLNKYRDYQVLKKLIKVLQPQGYEEFLNEMKNNPSQELIQKQPMISSFQDKFLQFLTILKKEKQFEEVIIYLLAYNGASLTNLTQININQILSEKEMQQILKIKGDTKHDMFYKLMKEIALQNQSYFTSKNGYIFNTSITYDQLKLHLKEVRNNFIAKCNSTELQEFTKKLTLEYVQKMREKDEHEQDYTSHNQLKPIINLNNKSFVKKQQQQNQNNNKQDIIKTKQNCSQLKFDTGEEINWLQQLDYSEEKRKNHSLTYDFQKNTKTEHRFINQKKKKSEILLKNQFKQEDDIVVQIQTSDES